MLHLGLDNREQLHGVLGLGIEVVRRHSLAVLHATSEHSSRRNISGSAGWFTQSVLAGTRHILLS